MCLANSKSALPNSFEAMWKVVGWWVQGGQSSGQ